MQLRRDVWKNLSGDTQQFVKDYLKTNLKLKESEFESFLFPDFEKSLLDGRGMFGMDKAVGRILNAIKKGELICIYGDYDCDGVPGTALLRDFFEKINYKNFVCYIPHRHTEGYGLNIPAIQKLSEQGVKLIITIDLGTTNVKEIDFANSLGIDNIVTDHHLPIEGEDGQILPKAYAILNNKQNSCNYANKDLCGSGTVFKLVVELMREMKTLNGQEKWLLDLVAIATIADMVPLTHENRTLAIYGLHVLTQTKRAGLHTIFKNAKTDIRKVTETDIGFTVAPRINSASRMATPMIALSMFSQNLKEGIDAAHELENLNKERKDTTKNIMKKIYKILDQRLIDEKGLPEIVVIGESGWNVGVLGILASKILDKYNVNVFCWSASDVSEYDSEKNIFKGSCRSRGDIHLVKLMTECKNSFVHFGGHELAGGFSVNFKNLHTLEKELNEKIEVARISNIIEQKKSDSKINCININLENINADILAGLNLIGPFGVGNPRPVFQIKKVLESKIERFGKSGEHLKIRLIGKDLTDRKVEREAIKFFVEKNEEENILEKFSNGDIFYEIEPGWMSNIPRLKIIN